KFAKSVHGGIKSVMTSGRSTATATPKAKPVRPRNGSLGRDVGSHTFCESASKRSLQGVYEPARRALHRSQRRARSATVPLPKHTRDPCTRTRLRRQSLLLSRHPAGH